MITSYAYTNVGGREVNEDSCIVLERDNQYCFVLCDGLGGHGQGEVASGMVTEVFKNCFDAGINNPETLILLHNKVHIPPAPIVKIKYTIYLRK